MKITCQACGAKYAIADDKVRGRRVKVRCKGCNEPIIVDGYNEPPPEDEAVTGGGIPAAGGDPNLWSVNLSDTDQRSMSTNEIVSAWNAGQIPTDAFVWREGMDDWVPLASAPDLQPYLSSPMHSAPVAAPPAAQPVFGSVGFAHTPSAQPEAARVAGGRTAGASDLFGNAANAGSEYEVTSQPAEPASSAYDDHRLTGARNENSVLFSLDALKAGVGPTPAAKAPVPGRAAPSRPTGEKADLDDIMNMGGGGMGNPLFALQQNQALLTAPAPPPEPPPRPILPSEPAAMGGSIAPAAFSAPQKNNKVILAIGGGVAVLAVLIIVVGVVVAKSGKGQETAKTDSAQKSEKSGDKGASGSDDKKTDDTAEKKTDDTKPPDPNASSSGGEAKAPVTEEEKKRFAEAMKKEQEDKDKKTDDKKTDDTAEKKTDPSSGVASFNKGAAISALGAASAQASGCKRPGGPTGSGKAVVTFAPSGRVTTANVSGGDFPGTPVGSCVASVFRRAVVPAFSGDAVTVSKSFTISP